MLVLALLSGFAVAQDVGGNDAQGRSLVPTDGDPQDPLWGYRAERQLPGSFGGTLTGQWADSPLVRIYQEPSGQTREPLLDNVLSLTFGGQYALHERLAVGLSAPLYLASAGVGGANGASLGDMRVSAPVGLVLPGDEGEGLGVAFVPLLDLPTGQAGAWLGNAGLAGGGVFSASYGTGLFLFSGDVGVVSTAKIAVDNLVGGPRLLADASAAWLVNSNTAVRLEGRVDPSLTSNSVRLTGTPAELGLNVRHRLESLGVSLTGGLSTAVSPGAGAARYRLFFGVGYTGRKSPILDTDGDGLLDPDDRCPAKPETVNSWHDEDGCPDVLAALTVTVTDSEGPLVAAEVYRDDAVIGKTDAQGHVSLSELMPETKLQVKATAERHTPSAAQSITLVEGTQEVEVPLKWAPGTLKVRVVDSKTDQPLAGKIRFAQAKDAPKPVAFGEEGGTLSVGRGTWKAFVEADGYRLVPIDVEIQPSELTEVVVPVKRAMVRLQAEEIQILDRVYFDRAHTEIMAASFELLEEVATVLTANPQITRVEVQGHTDSDGNNAYNLNLSQGRVESVVNFLVERGVDAARLVAKGYGETQPLVPNTSRSNKAKNRRVQFIILEQTPVTYEVPADEAASPAK